MNAPQEYEQRRPRVTAIEWTGDNFAAVHDFAPNTTEKVGEPGTIVIDNTEIPDFDAVAPVMVIAAGNDQDFHTMPVEDFNAAFEPVDE